MLIFPIDINNSVKQPMRWSKCEVYKFPGTQKYRLRNPDSSIPMANLHLPNTPLGSSHHCDEDGGCTCRSQTGWAFGLSTLDASTSFPMDSFQQNLPSAQQKKMALTNMFTAWSPWYDGPCADDTGSWLQPSRSCRILHGKFVSIQYEICKCDRGKLMPNTWNSS